MIKNNMVKVLRIPVNHHFKRNLEYLSKALIFPVQNFSKLS